MQKINPEEIQERINNQQLNGLKQQSLNLNQDLDQQRIRVLNRLWLRLTEIFGSSLVNQYGDKIPEAWVRLLTEISPEQIKHGLESLVKADLRYCPNAIQFRNLCLYGVTTANAQLKNDISQQNAFMAMAEEENRKHRERQKLLADPEEQAKAKVAANEFFTDMESLFPGFKSKTIRGE